MLFLIMPRPAICALKTIRNVTRMRERERESTLLRLQEDKRTLST